MHTVTGGVISPLLIIVETIRKRIADMVIVGY